MRWAGFGCGLFLWGGGAGLSRGAVLLDAQFPGGLERAVDEVFVGGGQPQMGSSVTAPAAGDGDEDIRRLGDEGGLLLRGQEKVAVSLRLGGEGGEDAAADTEVGLAHVR